MATLTTQRPTHAAGEKRTAVKKPRIQRKIDSILRTVWVVLAVVAVLLLVAAAIVW